VAGDRGQRRRRAEADQDQAGLGAGAAGGLGGGAGGVVHLDQVLLAGQSMPVPQQHQDLRAAEGAEGDGLPFRCREERLDAHVDCRRLRCWHWSLLYS
jgi:hypothetical protein